GFASVGVGPATAPDVNECYFFPDPRLSDSFACGTDNSFVPAFVNATVRFNVSVRDADPGPGEDMDVTFFFDYLKPDPLGGPPLVNPDSPTQTIRVASPGAGVPVWVETCWIYTRLSNFSTQRYWIRVEVRGVNGEFDSTSGTRLFHVFVAENAEPFVNGFQSVYDVVVDFPNPQVPPIYVNVTVGDPDLDAVTITWDWGDGNVTVNRTEAFDDLTAIAVIHVYSTELLPLNETRQIVRFPLTVWLDDGIANHNASEVASVEIDLDWDFPPVVAINSPQPLEPPFWKVGEAVTMEGSVSDPEGDPIDPLRQIYWDFDILVDSDGDGNPETDRDAFGLAASHAYAAVGSYTLSLWATDGETKKFCLDESCTSWITHWTRARVDIVVQENQAPVIVLDAHRGEADRSILLRAAVLDPDGDSLLITWNFGDGTANATNATVGQRGVVLTEEVFQEHVYANASVRRNETATWLFPYNLTVSVSDGSMNVSETRPVYVEAFNFPPVLLPSATFTENLTANSTFLYNTTAVLRVKMTDPEGDPIDLAIDWGDGNVTTVATLDSEDCTRDASGQTLCEFTHLYGDIGDVDESRQYTINVTITDNEEYEVFDFVNGTVRTSLRHTVYQDVPVIVVHPRLHGLGPWDVWDFSTLAVVLGLPAFLLGRAAWNIRRERQQE
ncbi:MAG: hypothetical protein ACT4OI_09180, partial [Methanobacteriota archaeon]